MKKLLLQEILNVQKQASSFTFASDHKVIA